MQFGTQMLVIMGMRERFQSLYNEHNDGKIESLGRAGLELCEGMIGLNRPNRVDVGALASIVDAIELLAGADDDPWRIKGLKVAIVDLLAVMPDWSGE
jgi:hypothetical protein